MRFYLLSVLLFICCTAMAQVDYNDYTPLMAQGEVPADFTTLSSQKYTEQKNTIQSNDSRHSKKEKEQFYLQSSFGIDDFLQSGRVIFNDSVSLYIGKVLDEVLKNDKPLRDSIRVYTFKSIEVNAFTTNTGIIFVSTALLAQLDNEAELAFILSHETDHFVKKHALDEYIQSTEIENREGQYKNLSFDEAELMHFQYSKEKETQADLDGLERYKTSNYNYDDVKKVFEVMKYSDLPFDEIPFAKSYFESGSYTFPKKYFKDSVSAITDRENVDDSHSDHPNIKKRMSDIMDKMTGVNNTGRKSFIVANESEFDHIRKICRFETLRTMLLDNEYEDAIYNAYVVQKDYPDNLFLKKIIAKSLYGLAKYNNADKYEDVTKEYSKMEGESQQTYYFFNKLNKKELNILALKYCWQLKEQYPNDDEIRNIANDLLSDLVTVNNSDVVDFKKEYAVDTVVAPVVNTDTASTTQKLTKYDRIAKLQKKQEQQNKDYYKYAFVDLLKDTDFYNSFKRECDVRDAKSANSNVIKVRNRKSHTVADERYALGLKKIVMLKPYCAEVDLTKNNGNLRYLASENTQLHMNNSISSFAKQLGINMQMLSDNDLKSTSTDDFNSLCLLNEWISEHFNHDGVDMINSDQRDLQKIIKIYGTNYYCWTGEVSIKSRREHAAAVLCVTIAWLPFLPYGIYYAVQPDFNSLFFAIVIDASTGEIKMDYSHFVKMRDLRGVRNINLYYMLQQISKTSTH